MVENKKPSFFDRFKEGFAIALKSLKFIWHHKKLILFPFLTASLIVSTIGIYEIVYYQLYHQHITSFFPESRRSKKRRMLQENQTKIDQQSSQKSSKNEGTLQFLLFVCVITFASIFFFAFFHVALSYATSQAFLGTPIGLSASLFHSIKKLPTLLAWAFLASIIHLIVSLFKGKDENGRNSFLSRLVGEAIEFAWYIATFLAIPVMAHEDCGVFKSIKQSAHLMKKTFGENLAVALFFPYIHTLIIGVSAVLALCVIFIIKLLEVPGESVLLASVVLPVHGFLVLIASILCAIVSAATTVFKTAVYHYAAGNPVGPFNVEDVRSSFVTEAKK